jgi:peptide/nickel transport system substrate-binding protein
MLVRTRFPDSLALSRRMLLGGAAAIATLAGSGLGTAHAKGRTAQGGRFVMRLPWPLASIDPHRQGDGLAAILGDALFDTLYARDEAGGFAPVLAESEPEPDGSVLRVKVRAGVKTSRGKPFEPRDARDAIARARSLGARAWLEGVPVPRVEGRSLVFAMKDAARLVRALASPLVAMVPATFSPEAPEGTGPFRWTTRGGAIVLARNPLAARGPSFLDEVEIRSAPDLAASLRSFESGIDDVGWLGSGIMQPRAGSRPFDLGVVGWAVLLTGRDAASWDAPGIAQRLCDEIPPSKLVPFALGPAWSVDAQQGWGGPPSALVVREDAPWLVELARAVAASLSRPGSEVTARPVPLAELAQKRASQKFALALDVVRPFDRSALGALVALATAEGGTRATDLMLHPPKLGDVPARTLTRTLRCGVLGEVRVQGGRVPDLLLPASPNAAGFDLGAASRGRPR